MLGQQLLPLFGILLLLVSRKYAPLIFFGAVFYLSMRAGVILGGINLQPLRIMIIFGIVRILFKRELPSIYPLPSDWLMACFVPVLIWSSLFYPDVQAALIYRLGVGFDILGVYGLFRCWVLDLDGYENFIRTLAIVLLPIAILMTIEKATGKNAFSFIGGMPAESHIRGDHLRAQGPFRHPISAGTIPAVCFPLFYSLRRSNPKVFLMGTLVMCLMVFDCASSGPIMSVAAGCFGLLLYKFRKRMQLIFRLSIVSLVALHLFMKAPVWYLIARIDFVGGSTGHFRSRLIDAAISHFNEWWLAGTDVTRHWMPSGVGWSTENTDITNNYIKMGVVGGVLLLLIFIVVIAHCYKMVGAVLRDSQLNLNVQRMFWCIGCSLFAHNVSMISVSYFDQALNALLYSQIAILVTLSKSVLTMCEQYSSSEWSTTIILRC